MGLDMFLFSIQKGKEKYLVDDKYITQLPLSESYGLTTGFIFMPVGVRYEDQIKLGGDLCPYNLVVPNCKNPGQYHKLLHNWSKCNAIHRWFVENVQNGIDDSTWHRVSLNQLKELKSVCEEVLKHSELPNSTTLCDDKYYEQTILDSSVAERLLPTMDGPFFGSTEYDGYYIESLKETIKCIEKVIHTVDFKKVTVFYNSWS